MTEIKRQSTVQPEQTQGFNSPPEDELRLIDLLKFLARKKVLILAVTSFCTLFSIFYAQSITPVYRATVGLLDHNESFSSSSVLEQAGLSDEVGHNTKSLNIFERFLFNVRSYELKQEVFVKGGFQKKLSRETGIDTDQSVSEIYSSTKIIKRDGIDYLELDGSKPKVMLEFLTALVEAAKENVNTEINEIQRSTIKTSINNLSMQIEEISLQKQIEKEKKAENKIVRLSRALDMAKRMGIKDNNFDKPDHGNAPVWFRYGELALQQKIKSLRSQKEETPKPGKLSTKKLKLKRLQNVDLRPLKFKVATIGKHNYFLVRPIQTWVIVGFGVIFGLLISIFMAFVIDQKKRAEENPSTST